MSVTQIAATITQDMVKQISTATTKVNDTTRVGGYVKADPTPLTDEPVKLGLDVIVYKNAQGADTKLTICSTKDLAGKLNGHDGIFAVEFARNGDTPADERFAKFKLYYAAMKTRTTKSNSESTKSAVAAHNAERERLLAIANFPKHGEDPLVAAWFAV